MAHQPQNVPKAQTLGLAAIELEGKQAAIARAKQVLGRIESGEAPMPDVILRGLDRQTAGFVFRELARRAAQQKTLSTHNKATRLPSPKSSAPNAAKKVSPPRNLEGWSELQKPKAGYLRHAATIGLIVGVAAIGIAIGTFEFIVTQTF